MKRIEAGGIQRQKIVLNVGRLELFAAVMPPAGRYIAPARNHRHNGERVLTLASGEVTDLTTIAEP